MRVEQISNVVEIRPEQMPVVKLRLADPEDFEQLKKLNLAALELDPSAFGEQSLERKKWEDKEWQEYIGSGRIQVGINEHGEIVAMAGAKKKQEGIWQLHSVYIDPEHRKTVDEAGHRLSEGLLQELMDTIRDEEGANQMDLVVNKEKTGAVKLYERLGFVMTEELKNQPSADGLPHDKLVMSKVLTRREDDIPLAA